MRINKLIVPVLGVILILFWVLFKSVDAESLSTDNGWIAYNGKIVWGFAQVSEIWKVKRRPNITKNYSGNIGPNRTEDLDLLTSNMLQYGYPALEHSYGLWYDRRRDAHDTNCRNNGNVVGPFLEFPWGRNQQGLACDGLSKFDLSSFNPWYFKRLSDFAKISDRKGTLLIYNYYLQHHFLGRLAHYVDFPWYPGNSIQDTQMPDRIPAANAFFDPDNPVRNELHQQYIRRVLDEIGEFENVFHFTAAEYTGDFDFIRFWMDTILEWEATNPGQDIRIGISAPKKILDRILLDPKRRDEVDAIDLRYFWYSKSGKLAAIPGGEQKPGGKYFDGSKLSIRSSPEQVYRQVLEYRQKYPNKVIFHSVGYDRKFILSFLMAGGSINAAKLHYEGNRRGKFYPKKYGALHDSAPMQFTYDFINRYLSKRLPQMKPETGFTETEKRVYALASDSTVLVYTLYGGEFVVNLESYDGPFVARWFSPETGVIIDVEKLIPGGAGNAFETPDESDWVLLLEHAA